MQLRGATWGNRIYDETALEFLAIPSHGFLCAQCHIVAARGQTHNLTTKRHSFKFVGIQLVFAHQFLYP